MHTHTNKLINETSPYLLQHAHNPVNWYPWGPEALERAVVENKPILVSIGYAACHWCHVMERESFENEETARLMNEHFINIKIDREERPDLDHIYMDAVQAMTGSGGWPLNVFLTPSTRPFYGGTYYPPVRAFNRASWPEVLQSVIQAFNERRHEIDAQAENLTQHLEKSNSFGLQDPGDPTGLFTMGSCDDAFEQVMKSADTSWGGFGKAPKFPQTFTIQFLFRYHHEKTKQLIENAEAGLAAKQALDQALLSLNKMTEGGIYDQLGGGFARYSTDTAWLAPHFEKMLYDNALLVSVLSEAYQLTHTERYREVIAETIGFVQRELMHSQKGFYAALDADSEGEEGKFYVWQLGEVKDRLGEEDASIFCSYYNITEKGNWEEKNILRVLQPLEAFAAEQKLAPAELALLLERGRNKLMEKRAERVRPLLDDKVLLGWNALMNTACSKAFAATGEPAYRDLAIENMKFILKAFAGEAEDLYQHTWKNGKAKYPAFLDDYAYLVQALLHLQEITADTQWLEKAEKITNWVIEHFGEAETGFFYYTREGQADIIVRKKEMYDGAQPSGNAVMAANLYQLGILFDRQAWKQRSVDMLTSLGKAITRYPTSFGCWNSLFLEIITGTTELAIIGPNFEELHKSLLRRFIPQRILMASGEEAAGFPLLAGKPAKGEPVIYVCRDYACLQPVNSVEAVMSLINSATRAN